MNIINFFTFSDIKNRNTYLDFLRFVAIILVMLHHAGCVVKLDFLAGKPILLLVNCGWVGVDLFFVLSGYLVSGLLFDEYQLNRKIDYKRFLIRRGFKIYPSYYLYIIVTYLVYFFSMPEKISISKLMAELFFYQNYFPGVWAHTWSLAVEEHFYFLLCLLFAFFSAIGKMEKPCVMFIFYLFIAALLLAARYYSRHGCEFSILDHIHPTHLRLDSLMLGVVCKFYTRQRSNVYSFFDWNLFKNKSITSVLLIGLGVLLISPSLIYSLENEWVTVYGYLLFALGSASLVLAGETLKIPGFLNLFAEIGRHSYSIYLWHMVAGGWITNRLASSVINVYARIIIYLIVSILLGIIIAKLIEIPMIKLRDKLFPSK